jgi:protein-tyrosine-phosphatase
MTKNETNVERILCFDIHREASSNIDEFIVNRYDSVIIVDYDRHEKSYQRRTEQSHVLMMSFLNSENLE